MFEDLKTKLNRITDKRNKNPVARIFQNPEYTQDQDERRAQILFLKLLMITAYADNSIDQSEMDLIKSLVYENCLTEAEWREINLFKQVKPSKEEIHRMIEDLMTEINSVKARKKLLRAIKDIVEADDILREEEKEIIETLEEKLKFSPIPIFGDLINQIKTSLTRKKNQLNIEDESREYSMNPIAPYLKKLMNDERTTNIDLISAKLGLAIIIINSDMEFHEKERKAFEDLIRKECDITEDKARDVASELLNIPDTHFEIAYLSRIITDSTDVDERRDILANLFRIARADKVYSPYEDKYLKIISTYLLLSHKDFIAVKLSTQPQSS
jgi:uncharacterized tellurite resistance protein B-like protein